MRARTLALVPLLALAAQTAFAQEQVAENTVEMAARARLKSDLRNLVTAQEAYYAGHSAYSDLLENLKYIPSRGVQISFTATQNNAWGAIAVDASLPGRSCVIYINLAEKYRPKTMQEKRMGNEKEEGRPICDGDRKPEP